MNRVDKEAHEMVEFLIKQMAGQPRDNGATESGCSHSMGTKDECAEEYSGGNCAI